MALAAQPANDRKRVKVYELKNGDWFDRGTGFCTGTMVNVRRDTCLPGCPCARARPSTLRNVLTSLATARMKRASTSSPKTSPYAPCSRLASRRMMDIRSNKVKQEAAALTGGWDMLRIAQIHSLCGRSRMAPTWRLASRRLKAVGQYGTPSCSALLGEGSC